MNENIVRCYYKALILTPDSYRKSMHTYWCEIYRPKPELLLSEKRICDQRRTIFNKVKNTEKRRLRGHLPSQLEIDALRDEAYVLYGDPNVSSDSILQTEENCEEGRESNMADCIGNEAPAEERLNQNTPATETDAPPPPNDPLKERLRIIFEENKYTPFKERKKLIKPPKKFNGKLNRAMNEVKKNLERMHRMDRWDYRAKLLSVLLGIFSHRSSRVIFSLYHKTKNIKKWKE